MKRALMCVAVLVIAIGMPRALAETPVGFGYINTNRTNVRESMGGEIVTRLNDGDAVYVVKQQLDSRERLWYLVNTEYGRDRAITVWVQARYVTAGADLFSNIVQVAAGQRGMLALRADGTVTGAANENVNTREFRRIIARWTDVKQIACGFMTYIALREDGALRGFGNMAYEDWDSIRNVRLLDARGMEIAFLTQDGDCNQQNYVECYTLGKPLDWQNAVQITACPYGTIALYPDGGITCVFFAHETLPPEFDGIADWHNLSAVRSGYRAYPVQGADGMLVKPLLAGLHTDGTVTTFPKDLFQDVQTWTDIRDVRVGWNFLIGLRADGTVAYAGEDAALASQLAEWTEITAIDANTDYCVGIKADGTLVFAGEYTF